MRDELDMPVIAPEQLSKIKQLKTHESKMVVGSVVFSHERQVSLGDIPPSSPKMDYALLMPELAFITSFFSKAAMVRRFTVRAAPMGAPRQTRADRWKKRDCVIRYRALCDKIREAAGPVDQNTAFAFMRFFIAMPESWSEKKKKRMEGTPHLSKPDTNNLSKLCVDALIEQDACVFAEFGYKQWCLPGHERTEVTLMSL